MSKTISDMPDDVHSIGGSLVGTLASRRSRTGTMTSVNILAKNLREYHAKEIENGPAGTKKAPLDDWNLDAQSTKTQCNSSFHHFRFVVVFLAGVSLALMLTMRYGITISILKMVNQTHLYLQEHPERTVDDFLAEGFSLGGEFNWNNEIVSIISSWYMFAYTIPQVFTTQLGLKIGCHKSVPISLALCAFSQLITPMCAYLGWQYVVMTRLINGLGASSMAAVTLNIVETWMRPEEIQTGLALVQGCCAAAMFSPILIGYLADIHWVYSFYAPTICTLVFCAIWCFVASDRPEKSHLISQRELTYIMLGHENAANGIGNNKNDQLHEVHSNDNDCKSMSTCMKIFKVPSFYAYLICWTIFNCANHGYLFVLPTYLRQFLKIGVAENGFYGTVISLGGIVPVIWPSVCHKFLLKAGMSLTNSRRVLQTICCFGFAISWIYAGFYHDNQILAFFLNRCFFGANDVLIPASLMSNFGQAGLTSVAYSIMNSISDVLIIPTSTLIGWMLDQTGQSRECWSWILMMLGFSHIVLWFIFVTFIDSEPVKFKETKGDCEKGEQGGDKKTLATNVQQESISPPKAPICIRPHENGCK